MPPEQTYAAALMLDGALDAAFKRCTDHAILDDPLVARRSRLPGRMRGCNRRSRRELAPIAFCSSFVRAAELMSGDAAIPEMRRYFGAGAFDADGTRLTDFIAQSDMALAAPYVADSFVTAWDQLRGLVAGSGVSGPLDLPAAMAGHGADGAKLQKSITAQVEQVARDSLHAQMTQLPLRSPVRQAWFAADSLSSQWVSALPTHELDCETREFREMATTYLGAASPAVRRGFLRGDTIPCGRGAQRVCDAYGLELGLATLPGSSDTICHDNCGNELFDICRAAGMDVRLEPRIIFADLLPRQRLTSGRAPGIIPDALMTAALPPATNRGQDPHRRRRSAPNAPSRVLFLM